MVIGTIPYALYSLGKIERTVNVPVVYLLISDLISGSQLLPEAVYSDTSWNTARRWSFVSMVC